MTEAAACPRCAGVALVRSPESDAEVLLFECPGCRRRYAQKPGAPLTYRWLHPVTLALYSVIFERDPVLRAASSATAFVKDRSRDELLQMADELELELGHPSVPVREALESIATEEQCREYLKAFVAHVRGHL